MRALAHQQYGSLDALEIAELPVPVPGADQILVRVAAASVNPLDWYGLAGRPWLMRMSSGVRRPKQPVLGVDLAGTIEAVGSEVTGLAVGDEVFGGGNGSLAEFALTSARSVVRRPEGVTVAAAAATPIAALTALQALRDRGAVQPGQSVLINGAAGGVGTFAVQLAASMGARVTGVCSTANVELVRSLGADQVIDYTTDDVPDHEFDLIIDNIGNHSPRRRRRMMTPTGRCVVVGAPKGGRLLGPVRSMAISVLGSLFRRQKSVPFMATTNAADLAILGGYLADGTIVPVISRTCTLADAGDALRQIGEGHTRGKIVVTIADH